jgi:predicted ATPase
MAIHTGVVAERHGDYYGPTVNRAARLRAVAMGGQILMSSSAASAAGTNLPAGISLRDLGVHALKDMTGADRIYQVVCAGLRSDFPALRTLDQIPNNIPRPLTACLGRELDVQVARDHLRKQRLLTLTGAGGTGKTRLALELANEMSYEVPDGLFFVDLTHLSDPRSVADELSLVLGLHSPGGKTLSAAASYLSDLQALVILDNCEQVLMGAAEVAARLTESCPKLRVLCTSREPLRVSGEVVQRVGPLELPRIADDAVAAVRGSPSGQLFMERISAAAGAWALDETNARAVTMICHRLDGLPLALELAAPMLSVMPAAQTLELLDDRFGLLEMDRRSGHPHQRTLRATIDWSYGLLGPQEQRLLEQLSVFTGGFDLRSMFEVCDIAPDVSHLARLVDKSLVVAEQSGSGMRYRLFETIREYAMSRRHESERDDALEMRHARYFCQFAKQADRQQPDLLEVEVGNIRGAIRYLAQVDPPAALELGCNVAWLWNRLGWAEDGSRQMDSLLPLNPAPSPLRFEGLFEAGWHAIWRGMPAEASRLWREALAVAEELNDAHLRARGLLSVASMAFGDEHGSWDERRRLLLHALDQQRLVGNADGEATCLHYLSALSYLAGRAADAPAFAEASMAISSEAGDEHGWATAAQQLAAALVRIGDISRAAGLLAQALEVFVRLNSKTMLVHTFDFCSLVAAARGDTPAALRLGEAAGALGLELGYTMPPAFQRDHEERLTRLRAVRAEREPAPTPSYEDALDLARAVCGVADP